MYIYASVNISLKIPSFLFVLFYLASDAIFLLFETIMSQLSEMESLQAKINYATRKSIDRQQKRFQSTKNTRMFVTKKEFSRKNALKNATSL